MNESYPPEGHPISVERAKELISGPLGNIYRDILMSCCEPIFWYQRNADKKKILHNGTLTIVKTPKLLFGITAAHVLRAYEKDKKEKQVVLQLFNAAVDNMLDNVINISDKYDLATITIDEKALENYRKKITPLEMWPPKPPQEGRAIMIAGYPGIEREESGELEVTFGLFTVLDACRTVTETQITWLLEPEYQCENADISSPQPQCNLGGVSGGPLISLFESDNFITHHRLSGIVTEHPDYDNCNFSTERLVAVRADLISEDGKISQ